MSNKHKFIKKGKIPCQNKNYSVKLFNKNRNKRGGKYVEIYNF